MGIINQPVKRIAGVFRDITGMIFYAGKGRFCPVCGKSSRRFRSYGLVPRSDALCVYCHSLERHRFLWLFLQRKTDLFSGKANKMLHVAPEKCLQSRFKQALGDNYITADLLNPAAMVKMDVTNIQFPDQSFDIVYCSHVLEHVLDDKKAMREFYRVLKPDGWAILLVPIEREKTYEDETIVSPVERLKAFGQSDHVRIYGHDYVDRLRESGFIVDVVSVRDLVNTEEAIAMGLTEASGEIFYCTK